MVYMVYHNVIRSAKYKFVKIYRFSFFGCNNVTGPIETPLSRFDNFNILCIKYKGHAVYALSNNYIISCFIGICGALTTSFIVTL